jgi:probable H4MPT-linked C1 transfer pathway protein
LTRTNPQSAIRNPQWHQANRMNWLALDIGGANLKMADGLGFALASPFELWREPGQLSQELRTLIAQAPPTSHLAVTMTGELCDCFETKSEGVKFILQAVIDAADGRHTRVYRTDGKMVTPQAGMSQPLLAAASNWHALARFCGRFAPQGPALLIDVGSTTCDVIPLRDGAPATSNVSDTQRLAAGELVYTGVQRSPVCAILESAPYRGGDVPIAQEVFATTLDVYIILKELAEDPTLNNTADNRPATKGASRRRLARMICADDESFNHRDAVVLATAVRDAQAHRLASAAQRVMNEMPDRPQAFIVAGQGEFLARRAVEALRSDALGSEAQVVSLARDLGFLVSRCACAHALAVLSREATEA